MLVTGSYVDHRPRSSLGQHWPWHIVRARTVRSSPRSLYSYDLLKGGFQVYCPRARGARASTQGQGNRSNPFSHKSYPSNCSEILVGLCCCCCCQIVQKWSTSEVLISAGVRRYLQIGASLPAGHAPIPEGCVKTSILVLQTVIVGMKLAREKTGRDDAFDTDMKYSIPEKYTTSSYIYSDC